MKVKEQLESFFSNFDSQNISNNKEINECFCDKNNLENFNFKNKNAYFKTENGNNNADNISNITNISCLNDYEELLRKHESEIRNHIKIQHQYRIYSDNLKNKIEDLEKSKAEYKKNIANLQEVIKKFNSI